MQQEKTIARLLGDFYRLVPACLRFSLTLAQMLRVFTVTCEEHVLDSR